MKDKISVIMPVYKENEEQLRLAVNSILNQTYSNLEFIVIVDNPEEIWRIDLLNSIGDKRMKVYVNSKNEGITYSLNRALGIATGKYIARMDADDISLPNRLEIELKYLNNNNLDMCGSDIVHFVDNTDLKKVHYPSNYKSIKALAYIINPLAHPTYLVKKEVYDTLNGYTNIFACEDYDFFLRAINKGYRIGNVPEILLRYRVNEKSISRSNSGKQTLISYEIKKFYKRNKTGKYTQEMAESFLNSERFKKSIDSYEKYHLLRTKVLLYKSEKSIIKYVSSQMLSLFNFKYSIKRIREYLYKKFVFKYYGG